MDIKEVSPKPAKCEAEKPVDTIANPTARQVECSLEQLKQLMDAGHMPQELGEWYINHTKTMSRQAVEIARLSKEHPHKPMEHIALEVFSKSQKSPDEINLEMANFARAIDILLENKAFFEGASLNAKLFENVDSSQNFGISNVAANPLYRLIDLLKVQCNQTYKENWIAKGSINTTSGLTISLEYGFQASSQKEADHRLDEYKKIMMTKGLKLLLAYWKTANELGKVEYTSSFTEILKRMSDRSRSAFFSVKEKQEYWLITRMLKNTTIKSEKLVRETKNGKSITRWVEQPVVAILGGENEESKADKYPLTVTVRLLSTEAKGNDFAPIIYTNSLLMQHPNDVLGAFTIQTRPQQEESQFDWPYIFKILNLEQTAAKNPSVAKARARKKMEVYRKSKIIEGASASKNGMKITRLKSLARTNKKSKKSNSGT